VSLEENEVLISPDEGAYLPVLDIMHKVTVEASGGSLKIEEWCRPDSALILDSLRIAHSPTSDRPRGENKKLKC
jgi:hypothetical protein